MNALHLDNLFITLCSRLDPYQELKLTLACSQNASRKEVCELHFQPLAFFWRVKILGLNYF